MSKKLLLTLLPLLALAACEGNPKKPGDDTETLVGGGAGMDNTQTTGIDTVGVSDGTEWLEEQGGQGTETFVLGDCEPDCDYPRSALDNPDSLLAKRLVFFAFDSDAISQEYSDTLIAHGKYLASNPEVTVRLEGHTDERGTREYNLALSEKRAQAVRRFLMLYGARAESIGVYGFGEELPLALGHNEAAYAENRRVELVYDANN